MGKLGTRAPCFVAFRWSFSLSEWSDDATTLRHHCLQRVGKFCRLPGVSTLSIYIYINTICSLYSTSIYTAAPPPPIIIITFMIFASIKDTVEHWFFTTRARLAAPDSPNSECGHRNNWIDRVLPSAVAARTAENFSTKQTLSISLSSGKQTRPQCVPRVLFLYMYKIK